MITLDDSIRVRIGRNWGLGRIFRWMKGKLPVHGESLLLARILSVSYAYGYTYSERSIRRVINEEFEEEIPQETKKWILKKRI